MLFAGASAIVGRFADDEGVLGPEIESGRGGPNSTATAVPAGVVSAAACPRARRTEHRIETRAGAEDVRVRPRGLLRCALRWDEAIGLLSRGLAETGELDERVVDRGAHEHDVLRSNVAMDHAGLVRRMER